jgi:hypothetical protein
MGPAGRVGPVASPRSRGYNRRADPIGPVQTRTDQMRRPTGDAHLGGAVDHVLSPTGGFLLFFRYLQCLLRDGENSSR